MKILIAYSSLSGNTKRVAETLYEEFKRYAVIMPIEEVKSLDEYDYIFLGYYVDKGTAPKDMQEFMKKIEGKKVGLFATAGVYPHSIHAHKSLCRGAELLEEKNQVLGGFICQGSLSKEIMDRLSDLPEDDPHYPTPAVRLRRRIALNHPDKDDLRLARRTFRDMVELDI